MMGLFFRKKVRKEYYDAENKEPVIRCSICTGEQVACFRDRHTGDLQEILLIRNPKDLEEFRERYGIEGKIEKSY